MMEARVLDEHVGAYPVLEPGRWYPVTERGLDDVRPAGPSSSGGGPTGAGGIWLQVDGRDQFVFRRHVQVREAAP